MNSTRRRRRSRHDEAEEWWPLVREWITCGLGVWILVWQTALEENSQAALVTAGVTLVTVPVAGTAQRLMRRIREDEAA